MAISRAIYTRLWPSSTRLFLPPLAPPFNSRTYRRRYISTLSEWWAKRRGRSPKKAKKQPQKAGDKAEKDRKITATNNPVLDNYYKKQRETKAEQMTKEEREIVEKYGEPTNQIPESNSGSLQANSIINKVAPPAALKGYYSENRAQYLDPKPLARRRWQRKMVIREVRRGGRLSKAERLKRTERALTVRSKFFKTSMKKLNPMANQIKGKKVEDAITQMTFSKKKVAMEVKQHLEEARDRAIARRGMGLGEAEGTKGEPVKIRLKNGRRHEVEDRTGIYVDQAWTGKGTYGRAINPRARGRRDMLRLPQTSISVLLKEEKTRVREHEERYEKWRNRKMWNPLPDRPLVGQRQYYSW